MRSFVALCVLSTAAFANQLGVVGYAGNSAETCNTCHSGGAVPTVSLTGPSTLQAGQTGDYRLTVSGGAGSRAGMNVAVDSPAAQLLGVAGESVSFGNEVHHAASRAFTSGRSTFAFKLLAPPFAGPVRLFGAGNSCNGNGSTSGDRAGFSTLTITITGGTTAPRIATPPTATPETVTTTTTRISVVGADDQPEAALTYTWSLASGPGAVTFAPNGTNAAKQTTATFTRAGEHVVRVLATDAQGQSAASTVRIVVQSTLTGIAVTPQAGEVKPGDVLQFSARAQDQFGSTLMTPSTFTWSVTGGGAIASTGRFVAGTRLGGPHVVQAVAAGRSGAGQVRVVEQVTVADVTPPSVTLVSPRAGEKKVGRFLVEVKVDDDVGVARAEVLINDVSAAVATAAPWRLEIDAAMLPKGPATVKVLAFDAAGNRAESAAIELLLDDPTTPGPAGCSSAPGGLSLIIVSLLMRRRNARAIAVRRP